MVADPEVDALIVATTETFRIPIIEAAAAAKKPGFCDKSLAIRWKTRFGLRMIKCLD
jgi:predicted dehydrogenase